MTSTQAEEDELTLSDSIEKAFMSKSTCTAGDLAPAQHAAATGRFSKTAFHASHLERAGADRARDNLAEDPVFTRVADA